MNFYVILGLLVLSCLSLCAADTNLLAADRTVELGNLRVFSPKNVLFNGGVHTDFDESSDNLKVPMPHHHHHHHETLESEPTTAWGVVKSFFKRILMFIYNAIHRLVTTTWLCVRVLFGAASFVQGMLAFILIFGICFGIVALPVVLHGGLRKILRPKH